MHKISTFRKLMILFTAILIFVNILFLYSCNADDVEEEYLDADTIYYIDTENSEAFGYDFNALIDKTSNITLRKNGTATISIRLKEIVNTILLIALAKNEQKSVDINTYIDNMLVQYLPGISLNDIKTTFEIFRQNTGIKILGIDYDNPEIQSFFDELSLTGKIPSTLFELKENIGIRYDASYCIKHIYSETKGEYVAIYMGEYEPNGEPFTIMTMSKNEKQQKTQNNYN